jgi:hypothetical protein
MMTFSRKRITFLLILLTAATLMPSYSLQGWLAGGHAAADLPNWFWIWETVAWSARALIEAGAILFLFETNAQTHTQERALLLFKVTLIALITLTLGVVVASAGLGQSIAEALPRPVYWLWSFAVASYAPLMLGSVGMAYRIQPHDTNDMAQPVAPQKAVDVTSVKRVTRHHVTPQKAVVTSTVEDEASQTFTVKNQAVDATTVEVEDEDEASQTFTVKQEPVTPKAEILEKKLWDELANDESRWSYYQEGKIAKTTDDAIAKELGVSRQTIARLKDKFNVVVTNGVHKE